MPYEWIDEEKSPSFEEKTKNIGKSIQRNLVRQGTNLGTRALGATGDLLSLANMGIAKPGLSYEETYLGKLIPTTEFHRKGLESKTGDYLKPQNKIENFADEVIEDTALMFAPWALLSKAPKIARGPNTLLKSFYKALGANTVKEGVAQIGGNEKAGDVAKIGSLLFLSMVDKPAAAKQVGKLYEAAHKSIPKGAIIKDPNLPKAMNNLIHEVTQERPKSTWSKDTEFVVKQAKNVLSLVQNGKIKIDQAWGQLREVNKELGNILPTLPWKERKNIRALTSKVNHALNNTLDSYGKINPEFAKNFRPAQEAFGTMAKSNFIANWAEKNIKITPVTQGLLHFLGAGGVMASHFIIGGAAKAAPAAYLGYQAAKIGYRIAKSPTLRKIYQRNVQAALKENVFEFKKTLKELDEGLQADESNDKYEFID
jgi:hypothetical protein